MARKFLTNIDLNQLELQNAAVQNLASAPANPVLGQIYFDTTLGYLRTCSAVAVGATPAQWISGGETFISSVSGNLNVDGAGDLTIDIEGLESTLVTDGFLQASAGSVTVPGTGDFTISGDANVVLDAGTGSDVYVGSATAGNEVATTQSVADAIAGAALNSTDDLQEGLQNLYFTGARVGQYISDNNLSLQGATGAQGADGYVGSDGAQGIQGEQGLQGEAGYVGSDGAQGATGAQGETGAQGIEGAQGIQGANAGILSVNGPLTVGVAGDLGLSYGAGLGLANGTDLTINTDGSLRTDAGVAENQLGIKAGKGIDVDASGVRVKVDQTANTLIFSGIDGDTLTVNTDVIATKSYVDATAQGLDVKASVKVATSSHTGYSNQFLPTVPEMPQIDGVTLAFGDRVLLNAEDNVNDNGIYVLLETGQLVRADDAIVGDTLTKGAFVFVESGTNAGKGFVADLGPFGQVAFSQFSETGNYITSVGTGLDVTGGQLTVVANTFDAYGAASTALTDANSYTDTVAAGKADADDATLTGTLTLDGSGDFTINADANVVFETPAGNVYLGSSTAGNEVATEGYVDTAVTGMVKKYSTTVTPTSGSPAPSVIHGLGTTDVTVSVRDSSGNLVEVDVQSSAPLGTAVVYLNFAAGFDETYTVVVHA